MKRFSTRLLIGVSMLAGCVGTTTAAAQTAPQGDAAPAGVDQPTIGQQSVGQQDAPQKPPEQAASTRNGVDTSTDGLQEIVVTAERRVSTAQKTAASISVRSGEELLAQGRYQLRDILENVPGVSGGASENSVSSFGSGTDNPSTGLVIRGIGSNVGAGGSTTSVAAAAAIYTDDVYNGLGSSYDIDRVEVLRGPQGTLYGRSANSGVVAIRTRTPDLNDVAVELTGEGGSYNLAHFAGGASLPIIADKVAVRVSGNYYSRDGFYAPGNGGLRRSKDGRVKLLVKPTDNFSAILGFAINHTDTRDSGVTISQAVANPVPGGADIPTVNTFLFTPGQRPPGHNDAYQVWGTFDWDLGGVKATYIPAFRTFKQAASILTRGVGIGFNQTIRTPFDHFITQEFRLASDNSSPFQWVAGAFYYDNKLKGDFNEIFNVDPITDQPTYLGQRSLTNKKTTDLGLFAQGTYAFRPTTRFTGGIRYDRTKIAADQLYSFQSQDMITGAISPVVTTSLNGSAGKRHYNNVTFKARLEQDLSPRNLVYASVSSGFTPGDVSLTTALVTNTTTFPPTTSQQVTLIDLKSETLTSYEIGTKNRFLGDRLQVNAAGYHYVYGASQVANINTSTSFGAPTFRSIAVPLRVWGAELEVQSRPWTNGQFSFSLDYSKGKYHDFAPGDRQYFAFTTVPGVAPFRVNASYNHTVPLSGSTKLLLTALARYYSSYNVQNFLLSYLQPGGGFPNLVSSFPNGLGPLQHLGPKVIGDLNATLIFANGKISLTGYVRNVADERFKTSSGLNLAATVVPGPAPIISVSPQSVVTLNEPRTFGGVLTLRF